MPDIIQSIIYGFALQVRQILGNDLSKIIVYGSYARGDYHENSDIDVMILVRLSDTQIREIASTLYDMAYDIELDKGVHISLVIKNEAQFEYWEDTLPFYRNVRQEGVEINAG